MFPFNKQYGIHSFLDSESYYWVCQSSSDFYTLLLALRTALVIKSNKICSLKNIQTLYRFKRMEKVFKFLTLAFVDVKIEETFGSTNLKQVA